MSIMENKVKSTRSIPRNNKKSNISEHYNLKKRPPQKFEIGKDVIYVSSKSNFKGLEEKCDKLVHNNEPEIIIHCLGAAIPQGILLALKICDKHPTIKSSVNTLTTELTDDLEPATDEVDYEIQKRFNSALRIKLCRTDILNTKKEVKL